MINIASVTVPPLRNAARKIWRSLPAQQRRSLQSGSTGVWIRNFRNALDSRRSIPNYGLLTVVIPVYNVEEYLDECVLSVVGQTYRRLQILLVDDGSTDNSLKIARRLARADRRIAVITKENNGLGAARNTGIDAAKGKFIAFVDSDDIVPKWAYEKMLESLERSKSDFVVGSINRLKEKKRSVPQWAQIVHAENRYNLTLDEYPDILHNVFAWNKVFRTHFWKSTLQYFPEGVLYEDQEITAKAYAEATSFDVLKTIVYDWRIRSNRSSITQQKDNVRDLSDRMLVTERLNEYLLRNAASDTYSYWLAKVLGTDLPLYYVQVPRVTDEYWDILQLGVSRLLQNVTPEVMHEIGVHERMLLQAIYSNSRSDFEAIVYFNAENGRSYPIDIKNGILLARPGYLELISTRPDSEVLRLLPESLQIKGELRKVALTPQNRLEITGYAYIPGVDFNDHNVHYSFSLVNTLTNETEPLTVSIESDPYIDIGTNDACTSYANTSFRFVVDPSILKERNGEEEIHSEWKLSVGFTFAGCTVLGKLTERKMSGAAALFPFTSVDEDGGRWIPRFSKEMGLSFLRENYRYVMNGIDISDRRVTCEIEVPENEHVRHVLFSCPKLRLSAIAEKVESTDESGSFVGLLPELPGSARQFEEYVWSIKAVTYAGATHDLAWPTPVDLHAESSDCVGHLRTRVSGLGYAQLSERRSVVRARDWKVDRESETISIVVDFLISDVGEDIPQLVFANGRSRIEPNRSIWLQPWTAAEYTFPLRELRWNSFIAAADSGLYTLRYLYDDASGRARELWIEVAPGSQSSLPQYYSTESVNLTFGRTPQASALSLRINPPLAISERGKLMQSRLQRSIPGLLAEPVYKDAVLFESFGGKTVGDSSLAIFEEMMRRNDPRPKYWSVFDHSVTVPVGAKALVMYSEEWYRVLHTAEYVVNNNNFPYFYRKHQDQKYVQVWHGTPLKRIGNDIPSSTLSLPYIKLMKKEAGYWDFLLAQNDFAAAVLPTAFGYEGKVIDIGYPRNDCLAGEEAGSKGLQMRRHLGIEDSKKVILYAPTWRDNVRTEGNQYDFISFLNVKEALQGLGDEYVFLIRGHHNVAQQRYSMTEENVIDVTSYPNINDLILASDNLVTDYSSVMFDYVVTGRPVYFLVPDLEEYRSKIRGFYFEFDQCPPGPLVMDTKRLVAELLLADVSGEQNPNYDSFRAVYAGQDDGHAASRVYERVWL